jgi:hypothetical protein
MMRGCVKRATPSSVDERIRHQRENHGLLITLAGDSDVISVLPT